MAICLLWSDRLWSATVERMARMRPRRASGRLALGVVLSLMFGVSCRSSDGETVTAQDVAEDQTVAEHALLTVSDLEPLTGSDQWSSQPRDQDDPEAAEVRGRMAAAEPACAEMVDYAEREGIDLGDTGAALSPDAPARAESPMLLFEPDDVTRIEHTVSVWATAGDTAERFEFSRRIRAIECSIAVTDDFMRELFKAQAPDIVITDYTATELQIDVGDQAFRVRIDMSVEATVDGSTAEFTTDFSVVRTGRITSRLSVFSVDGALDDRLDDIIVGALDKVVATFE